MTSTVPEPAGDVAVMVVALLTVKFVAAVPPKATAVAPVKLVPLMLTVVPPTAAPVLGERALTVGADAPPTVTETAPDVGPNPELL